jgi:uncharacterized membrane protein (DUF485 family)
MSPESERESTPADLTPSVGAATDITPLGRGAAKPAHEQTAGENTAREDWDQIAATDEFKALVKAKLRFIVRATLFFVVYYFSLPVLVGYRREWMEKRAFGVVNLAYLFALSQFLMAWTIAGLYVRAAGRFDKMAEGVLSRLKSKAK